MRSVGRAGSEIHEEGLVRGQRLLLPDPLDRLGRHIVDQVIPLFRRLVRLDRHGPLIQRGIPLIGLAADETVEVFEAAAWGGPAVERADRAGLPNRHFMAFPELRGGVAVELEDLGNRRLVLGTHRAVPRRRGCDLGDTAHVDRVMVASGQQRLPGRGAERGGMEAIELQAGAGQLLRRRGAARSAKGTGRPEPGIVDQHDQDIRRAFRRPQRFDRRKLRVRVLGVVGRQSDESWIGNRQLRPVEMIFSHGSLLCCIERRTT